MKTEEVFKEVRYYLDPLVEYLYNIYKINQGKNYEKDSAIFKG